VDSDEVEEFLVADDVTDPAFAEQREFIEL
jgi:hypothetical protein